jgi:hypothetical protein
MAATTKPNLNLPDHRTGDTFRAIQITLSFNGAALDLTGATLLCHVRANPTGALSMALSTSIVQASNGIARINVQVVSLEAGTYYWDFQVTTSSGLVLTPLSGGWRILQDVSR